jgi:hypothetical protein
VVQAVQPCVPTACLIGSVTLLRRPLWCRQGRCDWLPHRPQGRLSAPVWHLDTAYESLRCTRWLRWPCRRQMRSVRADPRRTAQRLVADPNPGTATFGATAVAGVTVAISNPTRTPLPSSVKPGDGYGLNLDIVPPTAPGTYTFALGIALDSAAPACVPLPHPVVLFAPVTHCWTGQACEAPAMLSEIPPATNPPPTYVRPAL